MQSACVFDVTVIEAITMSRLRRRLCPSVIMTCCCHGGDSCEARPSRPAASAPFSSFTSSHIFRTVLNISIIMIITAANNNVSFSLLYFLLKQTCRTADVSQAETLLTELHGNVVTMSSKLRRKPAPSAALSSTLMDKIHLST